MKGEKLFWYELSMGCVVLERLLGITWLILWTTWGSSRAVWMRAATRPDDGFEYMEYVLLYIDDILVVSHDGMVILDMMDKFFLMKEGSKGSPDICI
jgi:hypothetical protein